MHMHRRLVTYALASTCILHFWTGPGGYWDVRRVRCPLIHLHLRSECRDESIHLRLSSPEDNHSNSSFSTKKGVKIDSGCLILEDSLANGSSLYLVSNIARGVYVGCLCRCCLLQTPTLPRLLPHPLRPTHPIRSTVTNNLLHRRSTVIPREYGNIKPWWNSHETIHHPLLPFFLSSSSSLPLFSYWDSRLHRSLVLAVLCSRSIAIFFAWL